MLAKVFNKGQVVIPVDIRRRFHIDVGDFLEVTLDEEEEAIQLRKPRTLKSEELAGSLSRYRKGKRFPSRKRMDEILKEGLNVEE